MQRKTRETRHFQTLSGIQIFLFSFYLQLKGQTSDPFITNAKKKAVKEALLGVLPPLAFWNKSWDKEANQKAMNRKGFVFCVIFWFFSCKALEDTSGTSAKSLIPVILNTLSQGFLQTLDKEMQEPYRHMESPKRGQVTAKCNLSFLI